MEPWGARIPADLLDYLDTCERGGFYQAIAEIWGLPCESPREQNEIKRLVFRLILFGRVRPGDRRWRAFKQRWPSVANPLELIKEDDHGTTARACQRIESHIMIGGVVGWFQHHHPYTPIQTIHDAVLVVQDATEIAREAILSEFAGLGMTPCLKEKVYVDVMKKRRRRQPQQPQAEE